MAFKTYCGLLFLIILANSITASHECSIDRSKNYVCNGDFEQPRVTANSFYQKFSEIPCWTTTSDRFQLIKNQKGLDGQAMDMNTIRTGLEKRDQFFQELQLPITGVYYIEISYLTNPYRSDPDKSQFQVFFNDKVALSVKPTDKLPHTKGVIVKGLLGKNTIKLVDQSKNDKAGAYIDNLGLYLIKNE